MLYAKSVVPPVPESEWIKIVRSIGAGDQPALYELYARCHRLVFTLIMRIVNDRSTAEELTLDVFHDVWRRASSYDDGTGTVVGWILNQARSRAIDRVRFQGRKKRVVPHPEHTAPEDVAESAQDVVDRKQQGERLRSAVATLSPAERAVIEVTFFGECTYAEAATRLGQPLGTIKTRVRSGLMKLRGVLTGGDGP